MLNQIRELQAVPRCDDWAAKLQYLCEFLWAALGDPAQVRFVDDHLDPATVPAFADLLQSSEAFALAQMVIPELRTNRPSIAAGLHHRQRLVDSTTALRERSARARAQEQSAFDTRQYAEEKQTMFDAELHRVRLFLHHSRRFTVEEEQSIRAWLDSCPLALRRAAEHAEAEADGEEAEEEGTISGIER